MLETIAWIIIAAAIAIWFFSLIEDWHDIGPIDDDEPEEP